MAKRPSASTASDGLSPNERRLFELLTTGEQSTEELAKNFWRGRVKPFNARIVITNLARALVIKTAKHDVRVRKSKPTGPRSTTVWLERKAA